VHVLEDFRSESFFEGFEDAAEFLVGVEEACRAGVLVAEVDGGFNAGHVF